MLTTDISPVYDAHMMNPFEPAAMIGSCGNCGTDVAVGEHLYRQPDGSYWCADCDATNGEYPECEYCGYPVLDPDGVRTAKGLMHESCAEGRYAVDYGDSVYPN